MGSKNSSIANAREGKAPVPFSRSLEGAVKTMRASPSQGYLLERINPSARFNSNKLGGGGGGEKPTQEKGMLNYRGTVACMLYSFQVRVHKEFKSWQSLSAFSYHRAKSSRLSCFLQKRQNCQGLPNYFSPLRRIAGALK